MSLGFKDLCLFIINHFHDKRHRFQTLYLIVVIQISVDLEWIPLYQRVRSRKRGSNPKLYERCQNALKESQSYGNPKRMRMKMKLPCKFQTGMQVSRGEVMYGLDENFHTTSLQPVPFGDRPDRILLPHINLRYAVEDEKVEPDCRLMSWLQTMNEWKTDVTSTCT